ncbi:MAG: response regulator [Acidobacteria bacterium]|nr:response regulator [Acidobacteriota bacterium]
MGARHRVLVIDFEPRSLKRTLAQMQGTGFAISGAANGKEIAAELKRAIPDGVIVEPMIPGQDGFKLIQSIKRLRPDNPTFVIAASRIYRGPRFRGMAKEAGADLFVERPAQDDQLLTALVRALGEQPEPTAPQSSAELSAADISLSAADMAASEQELMVAAEPSSPVAATPPAPTEIPKPLPSSVPRPSAPAASPRAAAGAPSAPPAPAAVPRPGPAPVEQPALAASAVAAKVTGTRPRLAPALPSLNPNDDEIDAALDRLLGPFGPATTSAPSPAPAPAPVSAPAPAPAPSGSGPKAAVPQSTPKWDAADPLGLALDDDFRAHRPEPRKVTGPLVAFDLEEPGGGESPRPVVIPTPAKPAAPAAAVAIPQDVLGFDLVTGDSGGISAPPSAEDSKEGRYMDFLLQEDPGTGPPPIDPRAPQRTGPIPLGPEPVLSSPDDDDIDRVLARVFAPGVGDRGEVAGIDDEAMAAAAGAGPRLHLTGPQPNAVPAAPTPDRPVPAGLRGMDAGTADLLSSLEELENSLPDGGPPSADLRADSTWTATSSFGDLTGQALREIETSVPYPAPPPPEEERTLQEVLAKISMEAVPTAEEVEPSHGSAAAPFDSFRQSGALLGARGRAGTIAAPGPGKEPAAGDAPGRAAVPNAVALSSRAMLTGALVALVLLAIAAGGWYFFVRESADRAGPSTPPVATGTGDPMRFPAAPAPGLKKKPKLKRPNAGGATSPGAGATRPVPGTEKAPRRGGSAPSAAKSPTREEPPPAVAVPAVARPAPAPAALRGAAKGNAPSQASSRSAADREGSAADSSPPPTEAAAVPDAADLESAPIVRANELDAPVRATARAVPPPTDEALTARAGGRAFLNVLVAANGSVQEVRLMIDPGHGLGEAARRAAQGWRYTTPQRGGEPVRVWKTEIVEFEPAADLAAAEAKSR